MFTRVPTAGGSGGAAAATFVWLSSSFWGVRSAVLSAHWLLVMDLGGVLMSFWWCAVVVLPYYEH